MGTPATLKRPPRVVLDTNVLVSALILGGELAWLTDAWQRQRVRPLVSRATAAEFMAVLAYPKFRLSGEEQQAMLAEYLPWCEAVEVPASLVVPPCRDPDDAVFLQLAVAATADVLLTGDRDLLQLNGAIPVPIISPTAMKRRLGEAPTR